MSSSDYFEKIQSEWKRIQALAPKDKYKELKNLCMGLTIPEDVTLSHIHFYSHLIRTAKKTVGDPSVLNKKLQLFYAAQLKLLNVDISTLEILFKKNYKIDVNTATVGLGDIEYMHQLGESNSGDVSALMAQGKRLFFSTGSDGLMPIQIRVVNLEYPVFSQKESACFSAYSEVYTIHLPSGNLVLTDYLNPEVQVKVALASGYYRVCINVYVNPNTENSVYYICLAKITTSPEVIQNPVEIQTLE